MLVDNEDLQESVKRYYRELECYDWTEAADRFVGLETLFHRLRSRETLRLINEFHAGGRVLDVGCGTGLITRRLPPGSVGLDLNPRNLQKAERYANNASFALCDAEGAIPLRSETFDVVLCTEMLEHLLYPLQALEEISRVLRPGGLLLGSVPGRSLIWHLRWLSSSRKSFSKEPYHQHYGRGDVMRLLATHFSLRKLYSRYMQMNWFFAAVKKG